MINKTWPLTILIAVTLARAGDVQRERLGAVATACSDGWKFSASYVLESPMPAAQQVTIQGHTAVVHTDASGGRPDIFHRIFVDPSEKTFWGYDVEVEPVSGSGTARLRFKSLSLLASQLPKDYHALQVSNAADYRALAAPEVPTGTFRSGQVIAINVLINPSTGQKIVDYIEVEKETGSVLTNTEPRDFQISDVPLKLVLPTLRLNGEWISSDPRVADWDLRSPLIWISVPGKGRFLLSLYPYPGYAFKKAGVVNAAEASFSLEGNRYGLNSKRQILEASGNWNLYVLSAPLSALPSTADKEFSYGEVRSVEDFLSNAK